MKHTRCEQCNKKTFGSNRRRFCSDNCRVKHWQKEKRKKQSQLKRLKLPKGIKMSIEEAQFKALASILVLKEGALSKDNFALEVLTELDNVLGNIAKEIKHGS